MEREGVLEHVLEGREKPTNIPFGTLKEITEQFSGDLVIGRGGFATVYKGVVKNWDVAVKRIMCSSNSDIDELMFYREANCLMMIDHPHVVRFLGFCASTYQVAVPVEGSREHIFAEVRERLLCFEYVSNGSLQKHITDELRGLTWNTRYEIIRGLCEGLHYLHKEKRIYHMDLKPANILLDNHMIPKITDFGISRLDEVSKTLSEERHGSPGYCAPEYLDSGNMSFKSDMYSLGVIIIQLVTGEKDIPNNNNNNVYRRWRKRWKKSGEETPLAYQQVAKCIEIGLLCKEHDPSKRPFIWDIRLKAVNEAIDIGNEYTFGQVTPYSDNDMLGIEPLELHFPFELNKQISSSLELTNETDAYMAFNVKTMSPLPYCIEPSKDTVPPRAKCSVKITLQSQQKAPEHMQQAYAFILQSTRVEDGLAAENITADMFTQESGNVVDEVNLDVVFDTEELPSEVLDLHKLEHLFPFQPNNLIPVAVPLEFLKAITNDFSTNNELGRGGYGVVYKGILPSGKIIAVKKLFGTHEVGTLFQNEVDHLSGIKHQNLVQCLGYCAESSWELFDQTRGKPIWGEIQRRFVCFEYVCNGSLDKYISDESSGLEWNMRYEIIKGICSGLRFLHEECHFVHLDLKPGNILMDAAMKPKISDFGLSRTFGDQETRTCVTQNRVGTLGYMAPEYLILGIIMTKGDIFSLGVIIIELITGHRDYPHESDVPHSTVLNFTKEVVGKWRNRFVSTSKYKLIEQYIHEVKRCISVALKCVHHDRMKRPTAKDIIQFLNAAELSDWDP